MATTPSTGSKKTQREFLRAANEAIEEWARATRNDWRDKIWVEKTPSSDGNFQKNQWRTHCGDIVSRFNTKVAPIKIKLAVFEKDGLRAKKLKVTRKVLIEKATAARAQIRIEEAVQ